MWEGFHVDLTTKKYFNVFGMSLLCLIWFRWLNGDKDLPTAHFPQF